MSLPALVDAQLAWYYVVMIAFGGAMTLLSYAKIPGVPKLFVQPIYTSSLVAVPLALFAATVSAAVLSVFGIYGGARCRVALLYCTSTSSVG